MNKWRIIGGFTVTNELERRLIVERNEALDLLEDIQNLLKFKDLRVNALFDRLREPEKCPTCGQWLPPQPGPGCRPCLCKKPESAFPFCRCCGKPKTNKVEPTVREKVDGLLNEGWGPGLACATLADEIDRLWHELRSLM